MAEEQQGQKPEKNPHVYKPGYKKEEVKELVAWFEERMDRLPASIQLNAATKTSNLPRTVKALVELLKVRGGVPSVTFSGYVAHLELIRLRLKEQGLD